MASTSDAAKALAIDALTNANDWLAKAKFLRDVGGTHAEWDAHGNLAKLALAPLVPVRQAMPAPPPKEEGPAARLAQMHRTQFAASRMSPPARDPAPTPDAAVPRAVRAKQAAARGAKKVQKRAT